MTWLDRAVQIQAECDQLRADLAAAVAERDDLRARVERLTNMPQSAFEAVTMRELKRVEAERDAARERLAVIAGIVERFELRHDERRCELFNDAAGSKPSAERVCTCGQWEATERLEKAAKEGR